MRKILQNIVVLITDFGFEAYTRLMPRCMWSKKMEAIVDSIARVHTYENPDPRCTYPFEPCGVGYCWSYASHVDGTKGFEDIEAICKERPCECWVEDTNADL